jgi:multicomponent Na+:H+ antiporter subunit D
VLFLLPALSLGGVPPFAGFWAKLLLARAALEDERYFLTFAVLAVGLLTLYAMARIWSAVFWDGHPDGDAAITRTVPAVMLVPMIALTALIIFVGVNARPFVDAAMVMGESMVNPTAYIAAVLGEGS